MSLLSPLDWYEFFLCMFVLLRLLAPIIFNGIENISGNKQLDFFKCWSPESEMQLLNHNSKSNGNINDLKLNLE